MLEVVGADAGGQAVGRRIGDPDRVVDIRETDHRRDWAEGLLAHQLATVGHAVDDGRWVERALPVDAAQQLRTLGDGVLDPAMEQRPDEHPSELTSLIRSSNA